MAITIPQVLCNLIFAVALVNLRKFDWSDKSLQRCLFFVFVRRMVCRINSGGGEERTMSTSFA